MNHELDTLRQTKTILLTTYKRSGDPVATPVSIAFADDRAFFRTYDKAGKAKRLRNTTSRLCIWKARVYQQRLPFRKTTPRRSRS